MKQTRVIVIENKDDLAGVIWVNFARAHDKRRFTLTKLQAKGGVAIATDGVRLHKYTLEEPVPDGLYDPMIINQSRVLLIEDGEGLKYPDTEKVCQLPAEVCGLSPYPDQAIPQILNRVHPENYFNVGNLLAALKFSRASMFYYSGEEGDMIHVRTIDGRYYAAIMPCSNRPKFQPEK